MIVSEKRMEIDLLQMRHLMAAILELFFSKIIKVTKYIASEMNSALKIK